MALAKFAVSKHRSTRMATDGMERDTPETGRTRVFSTSVVELLTEEEVVNEVTKLWGEAQERFLAIGRYLVRAKTRFSGSFEKQIVGSLPFGKQIAYQLRMVAEAVDSGRLSEASLPRSYATAFRLATLAPPDLNLAKARGLVCSSVTRPEVDAFKRELRVNRLSNGDRASALFHERNALRFEMQRMQNRAREVTARLGEIEAEIGPDEIVLHRFDSVPSRENDLDPD